MQAFVEERGLSDAERRIALAAGSPGLAISMDLEVYDERRNAMLKLLEVAAGRAPFAEWAKYAEAMAPRKTEKLDVLLKILYVLLEDVLLLAHGARRDPQCATSGAIWKCWRRGFPSAGFARRCGAPMRFPPWCGATFKRTLR